MDTVVLVHGLWVHGIAMELMRRRVARAGYQALAYSYPSMRLTLNENAGRLARYLRELPASRLHLVGHSLGGLIVLKTIEQATALPPGRVVLAGTPFGESYAARRLERLPGGRTALGRSLPEWLEIAHSRPAPDREIGVIAGSSPFGLGRLVAPELPRPNDGVVSVKETRLPGMRDHIVLPVSHSGMLVSRHVVRQICAFLRNGAFAR
ncbi:MAG: alpha/beta hydrolase [Betaproteobacteria bacterium]|nr:alpha/beta hydrolase [Betaproteobacteria bacterium]MDH3438722.1 alpha/beta hydrolase [Betaproteobacteria bacterium]